MVAKVYCDHRLRPVDRSGQLDAWQNILKLKHLTVGAMGYGGDVIVEPGTLENFYLLMLPYAGFAQVDSGDGSITTGPTVGTILNATDPVRMRWSADCAKLMIKIDRRTLENQLQLMLERPLRGALRFDPAIEARPGQTNWWKFAELLINHAESRCRSHQASLGLDLLETSFMSSLLEGLQHNYSECLEARICTVAPRHVKLVEQYIEENAGESISLDDLIRVSGVSGRALYEGFRRFRAISPMAHLRNVRLRRAHLDLLNAPYGVTVSAIASRWGFLEFGRFASRYRQIFGETPSQTLRRR